MKQNILKPVKTIYFLFISMLFSVATFAQDKKVDINVNTKGSNDNFLMQPWVWVVGGAVFILLLIALLRNNNK